MPCRVVCWRLLKNEMSPAHWSNHNKWNNQNSSARPQLCLHQTNTQVTIKYRCLPSLPPHVFVRVFFCLLCNEGCEAKNAMTSSYFIRRFPSILYCARAPQVGSIIPKAYRIKNDISPSWHKLTWPRTIYDNWGMHGRPIWIPSKHKNASLPLSPPPPLPLPWGYPYVGVDIILIWSMMSIIRSQIEHIWSRWNGVNLMWSSNICPHLWDEMGSIACSGLVTQRVSATTWALLTLNGCAVKQGVGGRKSKTTLIFLFRYFSCISCFAQIVRELVRKVCPSACRSATRCICDDKGRQSAGPLFGVVR